MGDECSFGFSDLYFAAHGHHAPQTVIAKLMSMDQDARNAEVKRWANLAKWGTQDRIGTDGKVYTAFSPTWAPKSMTEL